MDRGKKERKKEKKRKRKNQIKKQNMEGSLQDRAEPAQLNRFKVLHFGAGGDAEELPAASVRNLTFSIWEGNEEPQGKRKHEGDLGRQGGQGGVLEWEEGEEEGKEEENVERGVEKVTSVKEYGWEGVIRVGSVTEEEENSGMEERKMEKQSQRFRRETENERKVNWKEEKDRTHMSRWSAKW